jgi:hypothetical protein
VTFPQSFYDSALSQNQAFEPLRALSRRPYRQFQACRRHHELALGSQDGTEFELALWGVQDILDIFSIHKPLWCSHLNIIPGCLGNSDILGRFYYDIGIILPGIRRKQPLPATPDATAPHIFKSAPALCRV